MSKYGAIVGITHCTICNIPVLKHRDEVGIVHISCYRCGAYQIVDSAITSFYSHYDTERKKSLLSGWIRRHQYNTIARDSYKILDKFKLPSIPDRATDLLSYIKDLLPNIGQTFNGQELFKTYEHVQKPNINTIDNNFKTLAVRYMPMIAESWSLNWSELYYLLNDYLTEAKGFLQKIDNNWKISPDGWSFLANYKSKNIGSELCFIAMSYKDDIKDFCDKYIEPAIERAGYKPIRMDKHPHTNVIDNEMLSIIRNSLFTVADLTYSNNGAYYEAGFSHGFGVPVIFLCETTFFKDKKVHFDANHYYVMKWDKTKGDILSKNLQFHIEANFGKGTYKNSNVDD